MRLLVAFLPSVVLLSSCAPAGAWLRSPSPFNVVIVGGRVIDPESGLDAVRTVAIRDGEIVAVTADAVAGMDTLDARGLVVTAGFIDLHSHAQDSAAYLRWYWAARRRRSSWKRARVT